MKCPNCGRENKATAALCAYCGKPLMDVSKLQATTKSLDDTDFEDYNPNWDSARFSAQLNLIISENGEDQVLEFDTRTLSELVIGRIDPETKEVPEVDLTEYGALDKGVSRRHASIVLKDGTLNIIDKDSGNGTFLNGQKLIPEQPRVLRNGDDIRLGRLSMRVEFVERRRV